MLARLDEALAPARAAVNREGNVMRIEPAGEAMIEVVRDVVEPMGYVVAPAEADLSIERWFGADEVEELSREEAAVLARRWTEEMGAVVTDPTMVEAPLRDALLAAFRAAARSGTLEGMRIDVEPLRDVLSDAEAEAVAAWIDERLGHAAG